jgi:hypothetical protein
MGLFAATDLVTVVGRGLGATVCKVVLLDGGRVGRDVLGRYRHSGGRIGRGGRSVIGAYLLGEMILQRVCGLYTSLDSLIFSKKAGEHGASPFSAKISARRAVVDGEAALGSSDGGVGNI